MSSFPFDETRFARHIANRLGFAHHRAAVEALAEGQLHIHDLSERTSVLEAYCSTPAAGRLTAFS